ncbi:DUF4344 domain-containing metallopeptidase [Nocardia transvalensis]|uniref:DUF4344 domain-containing metallopeptidase n=1 Tax=Nocardia transvalensis TaxID=37333 RepID=UPI0018939ED3|nr:DUF4344 domain-containing metallopeptidase [Nocardia transvalensis]MBF6331093.1 hypothetical protein [Nocardia transvalensis]
MKYRISAAVATVAAIVATTVLTACDSDSSSTTTTSHEGRFLPRYETAGPGMEQTQQFLQDNKFLELMAQDVNDSLKVPDDVPVIATSCGTANAHWDPEDKQIVVCYELTDLVRGVFADSPDPDMPIDQRVLGGLTAIFYHELGHALISLLHLPVTGKEEDAADQLATVALVAGDTGQQLMALSFADFWGLLAQKQTEFTREAFADEHSLSAQREINIVCWVFGSDPTKFITLATRGYLPEDRARRCGKEYETILHAWTSLLAPYAKTPTSAPPAPTTTR